MYLRQASFAGGEISATLQGRSDVAKYKTALARCRNLIPLRYGSLTTRPGMQYVAGAIGRMIPFILSNTTSYIIVFYYSSPSGWFDVYKAGVKVASGFSSPYTSAELARLKYAQQGGVLTICHPNHAPRELRRVSDASWTLTAVSFDAPAYKFWDPTTTGVPKLEMNCGGAREWDASTVYSYGVDRAWEFVTYAGKMYYCVWYLHVDKRPDTHCSGALGVDKFWELCDKTFIAKRWRWQVTTLFRDSTGHVFESAPFNVTKYRVFGRGLWNPTVTYALDDYVSVDEYTGAYYVSLVNGNIGNPPDSSPAQWSGPFNVLESGRRHIYGERAAADATVLNENIPSIISWKSQSQTPSAADPRLIGWRVYRGEYGGITTEYGWVGDTTVEEFTDYGDAPDLTRQPPQGRNPFKVYDGTGALVATENPTVVSYYEQRRVFGAPYASATGNRLGWIFGSKTGSYSNYDNSEFAQTADQEFEFELVAQRFEEIRSLMPVSKLLVFTGASEWSIGGSQGALAFDNVDAKVQGSHGSTWVDPLQVGNEALYIQERGPHVQSLLFDFQSQSWDGDELNLYADHLLDGHTIVAWCWAHQPYHAVFMVRDDGVLLSMTYHREQQVNAWAWHDTQGVVVDICSVPESSGDAVYLLVQRGFYTVLEKLQVPSASPDWRTGCYLDSMQTASAGASPTFLRFANQSVTVIQSGVATTRSVNGSGVIVGLTTPLVADIVVGLPYTQELATLAPTLEQQETKTLFASLTRFSIEASTVGNVQVGQDFDHLQTVATGVSGVTPQQVLVESRVANKFVKWPSALGVVRQTGPYPLTILSLVREIEFEGS